MTGSNPLVIDNDFFLTVSNTSGGIRQITAVTITNWPTDPSNQKVTGVLFAGVTIWSGISNSPPTNITSGWSGSVADRQIANGASKDINIVFQVAIQPGPIVLQITFDNNCIVSGSRP
jgi:hypothetical protein